MPTRAAGELAYGGSLPEITPALAEHLSLYSFLALEVVKQRTG